MNGKVYCVGGFGVPKKPSKSEPIPGIQETEIFDVEKNEWNDGPASHIKKYGVTLVVVADRYIYQFGDLSARIAAVGTISNNQIRIIERLDTYNEKPEWKYLTINDWWRNSDQFYTYSICAVPINYHSEN